MLVMPMLAAGCASVSDGRPTETAESHQLTGAHVTLQMRDGSALSGDVRSDDDETIYLETPSGRVAANKRDIVRVEMPTSPPRRKTELGAGGVIAIFVASVGGLCIICWVIVAHLAHP